MNLLVVARAHLADGLKKLRNSECWAKVIHDQDIDWGNSVNTTPFEPFSNSTVKATCTCKYYLKITEEKTQNERKYCSHIIGQLRRVIFML